MLKQCHKNAALSRRQAIGSNAASRSGAQARPE
jgi:hypothetical protein